jgi:hypothetical protein
VRHCLKANYLGWCTGNGELIATFFDCSSNSDVFFRVETPAIVYPGKHSDDYGSPCGRNSGSREGGRS